MIRFYHGIIVELHNSRSIFCFRLRHIHFDVAVACRRGYLRYFGDTGGTFPVPPVELRIEYLCQSTRKALRNAMAAARAGARINQIGQAIERVAQQTGFVAIKDLGSHGIGKSLHDEPHFIANFHDRYDERRLRAGQVITIEPFLSTGIAETTTAEDGWTLRTGPGNFSAQYEFTMVITKGKPLVMTTL